MICIQCICINIYDKNAYTRDCAQSVEKQFLTKNDIFVKQVQLELKPFDKNP